MIIEVLVFAAFLKAVVDVGRPREADAEKIRAEQGRSSRPVSEIPLSEAEKTANYWKNVKEMGHPKTW